MIGANDPKCTQDVCRRYFKREERMKKKFMTKKFMYLRDMKRYEKNDSSYRFDEKKSL